MGDRMKRSLEDTTNGIDSVADEGADDGANQDAVEDDEEDEDEELESPAPVQCWDKAVHVTDAFIRDAHIVWQCYGGDKSTAKSFWVDANATPTCCIEAIALQMADFHLQGAPYAGVEIWTQVRAANNPGLEFHFDKDEEAAARYNTWKHPVVGTATYLSSGGGAPLVIFATASPEGDEHGKDDSDGKAAVQTNNDGNECDEKDEKESSSVLNPSKRPKANEQSLAADESGNDNVQETVENPGPSHAWICYPVKGRHVAFAGNFLHGVPQELLFCTQDDDRISLLVNIWLDSKPIAVDPLAQDVAKKLSPAMENVFALEDSVEGRTEPMQAVELEPDDDLFTIKEHVPGDTAPLPVAAVRALVEKEGEPPIIQISYPFPN